MTATPKETEDSSNIEYFGEPIYTYSLKQGIDDGFLAPYKVAVSRDMQNAIPTNLDLNYRSLSGQSSPTGTSIIQNLSVVTPKALSEKELAREFKNLSRKLALEF